MSKVLDPRPGAAVVAELLRRGADARICVVGDLMIDEYANGTVDRLSPEAAVPVLRVGSLTSGLGGAGNLAKGLATLGATVELCAVVGDDRPGELALLLADGSGVGCSHVLRLADRQTTVKQRLVERGRQIARVDYEDRHPIPADAARQMARRVREFGPDAVVVSDYGKGVVTPQLFAELAAVATDLGVPLLVDPTYTAPDAYRGATLVKANFHEFRHLSTALDLWPFGDHPVGAAQRGQLAAAVEAVRARMDWAHLHVTLGPDGTLVAEAGRTVPAHVPTEPVEVPDESGAGDTVLAVTTLGIAVGVDPVTCAALGNVAARAVVARSGVVAATEQDLLAGAASTTAPVLDHDQLSALVAGWRAEGETVVFTNGCFDLFHGGHVHLLRSAAALGTRLVVAVDSDDSVRQLKGAGRPVRFGDDRCATVAAAPGVDAVVAFHTDELTALVERVSPDVLVKGADYLGSVVVGADHVEARGGRVELVPLLGALSTTAIAEQFGSGPGPA